MRVRALGACASRSAHAAREYPVDDMGATKVCVCACVRGVPVGIRRCCASDLVDLTTVTP